MLRLSTSILALCTAAAIAVGAGAATAEAPIAFFDKPWERVTGEEAALFEPFSKPLGLSPRDLSIERQALSWSPGASLYRIRGPWEPQELEIFYLQYPDGTFAQLTGKSDVIHTLNAKYPPYLTAGTVDNYLWFFTYFVRGAEGPFLIAEHAGGTRVPLGDESSLAQVLRPLACQPAEWTSFTCTATVIYSTAVFGATFTIEPTGMVRMSDDRPLVTDLKGKPFDPITFAEVKDRFRVMQPAKPPPVASSAAPSEPSAGAMFGALLMGAIISSMTSTTPEQQKSYDEEMRRSNEQFQRQMEDQADFATEMLMFEDELQ